MISRPQPPCVLSATFSIRFLFGGIPLLAREVFGLSVGQRQRFALTRALLATTPIVILDEPTAHLDAASEEVVLRAIETLRGQGRTVIAIAHRQALIEAADQVIEIHSAQMNEEELERVEGRK